MELDTGRFERLCREDRVMSIHDGDSIGTYSEKRLHRLLKRYVCEDAECYEVKLGKYCADVVCTGVITEIQTASFRPLAAKVRYYLENTELCVRVMTPIIEKKTLIRADRETGEIFSSKVSPKHERDEELLAKMYYLGEFAANSRFSLCAMHIEAEEYRYSEARRYNRQGRYDNDLVPLSLLSLSEFSSPEDYMRLFPLELCGKAFTADEFSKATRLCNRKLYSALNFYAACGILTVKKDGRKNIYSLR